MIKKNSNSDNMYFKTIMENKIKLLIIYHESSTRKVLEHLLNKEFKITLKNDGM